jgi:hypothetical protein
MSPPRDLPFGVRGARHIGLWNGVCLMNQFAKVDRRTPCSSSPGRVGLSAAAAAEESHTKFPETPETRGRKSDHPKDPF